MTTDQSLQKYSLDPKAESLPAIREILAGEVAKERAGRPRGGDLALLCCVQLCSKGLLEDVLRIWDAKCSGMDLGSYLDVELLCGAGLAETKRFLAGQGTPEAAEALAYICQCERIGDFNHFSPQGYLQSYRDYFTTE